MIWFYWAERGGEGGGSRSSVSPVDKEQTQTMTLATQGTEGGGTDQCFPPETFESFYSNQQAHVTSATQPYSSPAPQPYSSPAPQPYSSPAPLTRGRKWSSMSPGQ